MLISIAEIIENEEKLWNSISKKIAVLVGMYKYVIHNNMQYERGICKWQVSVTCSKSFHIQGHFEEKEEEDKEEEIQQVLKDI